MKNNINPALVDLYDTLFDMDPEICLDNSIWGCSGKNERLYISSLLKDNVQDVIFQ